MRWLYRRLLAGVRGLDDRSRSEWLAGLDFALRHDPRPAPVRWAAAYSDLFAAISRSRRVPTASRSTNTTTHLSDSRHSMANPSDLATHDLRLALRGLVRRPLFTAVAVLTLALGLGANAAVYSVFQAVLVEPLPYDEPGELVDLWSRWKDFDKTWVSIPEFRHYRAEVESFADVAIYALGDANLESAAGSDGLRPERVEVAAASANLLEVLGVEPMVGRMFTREEATADAQVLLLAHDTWQSRFGGDPDVAGRSLRVDGSIWTVIGVLPAGFRLPVDYRTGIDRAVLAPTQIDLDDASVGAVELPNFGGSHSYHAVARLAPGRDAVRAQTELDRLTDQATADGIYPEVWDFRTLAIPVADDVGGPVRPTLVALLAAVGLVLLLACANVAHLLMVRGSERRREVAVHAALGAGRLRILGRLLAEGSVLAAAGSLVGWGFAVLALRLLRAVDPGEIPRLAEATVDGPVLLWLAAATVVTALVSCLLPALQASRPDLRAALAPAGRGNVAGAGTLRGLLIAAEMALAIALLLGAGLLVRSLDRLLDIDPGFRTENVLTARVSLPSGTYTDSAQVAAFWTELHRRASEIPGVESAGLGRLLPLADEMGDWGLMIEGWVADDGTNAKGDWQIVTPGWIETLGIELLDGRLFEPGELEASGVDGTGDGRGVAQVLVINETMAKTYWPDANPLGRRVQVGSGPWATVIGVVADVRHDGLTGRVKEKFYRPVSQFVGDAGFAPRSMVVALEVEGDPAMAAAPLRALLQEMDPSLPLSKVAPLGEVVAGSLARQRFLAGGLAAFSLLALVLAAVGIASIVAFAVRSRRREIGVRLALGALPGQVTAELVGRGLRWVALGAVVGVGAALVLGRGLRSLLYEVPLHDPLTLAAAPLLLFAVAVLASWLPARRAARLDPVSTLREE